MQSSCRRTILGCYVGYIVQAIVNNFVPLLFVMFERTYQIPLSKITLLITINFCIQLGIDLLSAWFLDRIGGWFAGHYACDYETTFCHIPYFLIDSVRPQPIKSLFPNVRKCTERGLGAETEDLWDVLLLKPNQRRIYLLRFGAGEDRVFDY